MSAGKPRRLVLPGSCLAGWVSTFADRIDLSALSANAAGWLDRSVPKVLIDSFTQVLELAMRFYFLFFFLRDREAVVEAVRAYIPLERSETDRLTARARDTVRTTNFGTLLVTLVQGALGAFVVWMPAAAFLALEGRFAGAILLAGWGVLVVGTNDNLLHPLVVGDRLGLHTAPAFVAMVGGVIWLWPAGFVVGRVLLALTLCLIDILRARLCGNRNKGS